MTKRRCEGDVTDLEAVIPCTDEAYGAAGGGSSAGSSSLDNDMDWTTVNDSVGCLTRSTPS